MSLTQVNNNTNYFLTEGSVDRTFATETKYSGSIPNRVNPKFIKFGIHNNFPAGREK